MKSSIEVTFLTKEQLENARDIDYRYQNVGDDNLGFADKLRNKVYVRAGLDPDLTQYLLSHELSHLFELEGTDEDEYGIRHKKSGGFWSVALPIIMSIAGAALGGPILGAATSLGGLGMGGAAGSIVGGGLGAGAGSVTKDLMTVGKPNWGNALLSGAGSVVGGGLGNLASGMGASSGMAGLAGNLGQTGVGMLNSSASGAPGFSDYTQKGLSDYGAAIPEQSLGRGYGQTNFEGPSGKTSGGSGSSQGLRNIGLGQAGIALGGGSQDVQGLQGLSKMFGSAGNQGIQGFNPLDFNSGTMKF
jgi:hypothetical protein